MHCSFSNAAQSLMPDGPSLEPDEPSNAWLGPPCQLRECGLAQLLGYEPSDIGEKINYIRLNSPKPCPPRGTCPRSTSRAPAASFIGDEPEPNLSRDGTSQPMLSPMFWSTTSREAIQ